MIFEVFLGIDRYLLLSLLGKCCHSLVAAAHSGSEASVTAVGSLVDSAFAGQCMTQRNGGRLRGPVRKS